MRCLPKFKIVFFLFLFGVCFSKNSTNDPIFKDVKYVDGFKDKKICRTFIKNYKKGVFSQKEKSLMLVLISNFDNRSLANYNIYLDFFAFSNFFSKDKSDFLTNWLQSLVYCVSDLSDTKLEKVVFASNNFIQNSILSENNNFNWSFVGNFSSQARDTLLFKLELDSLILSNRYNDIVIHETEGFFDLRKNTFIAKNGFVDGGRFGIDREKLKIYFDTYEIDLSKRNIEAANTIMETSLYFDLKSRGHFSDYLSRHNGKEKFPKFKSYKDNLTFNFFNGFFCIASLDIKKETFFIRKFNEPLIFSISNDYLKGVFTSKELKLKNGSLYSDYVNTKIFFNRSTTQTLQPSSS